MWIETNGEELEANQYVKIVDNRGTQKQTIRLHRTLVEKLMDVVDFIMDEGKADVID